MKRFKEWKRKGLALLLCVVTVLSMLMIPGGGVMAASSVRTIGTWEQLVAWAKESSNNSGVTVRLTADITRPLASVWTPKASFAGTFDGDGHYISGLSGSGGLFTTASGTVRDLSILDSSLLSDGAVGAFVGTASGTLRIENCYTDAVVHTTSNNAAGFVGDGYGKSVTIVNSQFAGKVSGELRYVSAFIGNQNSGACVLENCLNTGSVYAAAADGNVAGFSEAVYNGSLRLTNCVNLGKIRYQNALMGFALTRTVRDRGRVTVESCYNLSGAADSKTYALRDTGTLNSMGVGSDFSQVVTDITSHDYAAVAATLGGDWAVANGELVLNNGVPKRVQGLVSDPKPDDGKTVVLGASDFQSYEDAHNTCSNQMGELLSAIKKDYSTADGLLFAGDYYHQYSTTESEKGMLAMMQTVENANMGIAEENIVKVQGNHDERGTGGLSPSGDNDPASGEYGVFVIHEDDYMWFAGSGAQSGSEAVGMHEQTVKDTAARLRSYLEEKAAEGFRRPIFVVSHLPLHYSMRTYVYGDARYARYLFDELNYGASLGLNILFLFGHDHSHGWDNHLGGSSVFLARGESINIGLPSDPGACTKEVLGFTYLNAGYVGYFTTDKNEAVDMTLTMTVYEITDDEVIISRYDKNGLHLLKAVGAPNGNVYDGKTEAQHGIFTVDQAPTLSPQSMIPVRAVIAPSEADCTAAGTLGYYETSDGLCYVDLGLTQRTTPQERAISALGHELPDSWTAENGVYSKVCARCGERVIHEHSFDNACDGECDDCGYRRTVSHSYGPWASNEEGHWKSCTGCTHVLEAVPHSYDGETDADCNVCGAVRTVRLAGDLNADGVVDLQDYILLGRYLSGWDVTLH